VELMLTLLQGTLGIVILSNLNFQAYEALGLLTLWFVQFCAPGWREGIALVYAGWLAIEVVSALWRPHRLRAFRAFVELWSAADRASGREIRRP
jgi:hypothetical protein